MLAKRTFQDKPNKELFIEFTFGLTEEAGEVVGIIKKTLFHGHTLKREKLTEELGDLLWYLTAIATTEGLSLEEIAKENLEKSRRRYPDGFSFEKSINREE